MFSKFFSSRRPLVYVQVWENRLKASEVGSTICFDEPPLVTVQTLDSGRKIVLAAGNKANEATSEPNTVCLNPFSHPRTLFSDFNHAEKLLKYSFSSIFKGRWNSPKPRVIIHPMEKLDGGLTQIEIRAFRELAYGAGAGEAKVHIGAELIDSDINLWEKVRNADEN